jgi:mannose/fructose/N-acetylgalactosamine-specific phosphotransferase system component IIC
MAGAALAIMYTGSYNVAASVPDNPIVEAFIATARRAKIRPISLKALIHKRPICQILVV